jgi:glycine hydroxymethyltransferase
MEGDMQGGIRLGSPALTTRGFGIAHSTTVANLVADVIEAPDDASVLTRVREEVRLLCQRFPVYS